MIHPFARNLFQASMAIAGLFSFSAVAADVSKPAFFCKGRQVLEAKSADGVTHFEKLLDRYMKGKSYQLSPSQSMVSLESNLVQYHGLKDSIRSIPSDDARESMQRVAVLIENNYVIAAKIAFADGDAKKYFPPSIRPFLATYVINMTEPYHGDPELSAISKKNERAQSILSTVTPSAQKFARWAAYAAAWDDTIALDASLAGFCMSSPVSKDHDLLTQALAIAKLNRSEKYTDPAVSSGASSVKPAVR